MPIYEYVCEECATVFECIRPMDNADNNIACESCDSPKTSRILSSFFSKSSSANSNSNSIGGCTGCSGGHCASCH